MHVPAGLAGLRARGLMDKVALVSGVEPETAVVPRCAEGRYGYIA